MYHGRCKVCVCMRTQAVGTYALCCAGIESICIVDEDPVLSYMFLGCALSLFIRNGFGNGLRGFVFSCLRFYCNSDLEGLHVMKHL